MTSYKEIVELGGLTSRVYDMFETFARVEAAGEGGDGAKAAVHESIYQGSIVISNVRVVTPNGDVIVPSLSVEIKPGMNLLITGPNGNYKNNEHGCLLTSQIFIE